MLQGASRCVLVAENEVLDAICGHCTGFIPANQYSRRWSSASDLGSKSTLVVIEKLDVEPKTAKGGPVLHMTFCPKRAKKRSLRMRPISELSGVQVLD